jgi:hypothetical protein
VNDPEILVAQLLLAKFAEAPPGLSFMQRLSYTVGSRQEVVAAASVLRDEVDAVVRLSSPAAVRARADAADRAQQAREHLPSAPHLDRIVSANRISGFEQRVRVARQQAQAAQVEVDRLVVQLRETGQGSAYFNDLQAAFDNATARAAASKQALADAEQKLDEAREDPSSANPDGGREIRRP